MIRIEHSRFAPASGDLAAFRAGTLDRYALAAAYRNHLRRLWREDRTLFLDLVEQAKAGDVTLVDEWAEEAASPRMVLSDVLRVLAAGQGGARSRGLYVDGTTLGGPAPR